MLRLEAWMAMETQLALISQARTALAKASTIDEVRTIRDKAEAVRVYAKAAGESLELQNSAAEIKIRAERKAGELLAKMGLRGGDRKSNSHDASLKLSEVGISYSQSHRWQKLASVPEKSFESHLVAIHAAGKELTSASVVKLVPSEAKEVLHVEPVSGVVDSLDGLIADGQKFGTIYADPPWQYSNKATRSNVDGLYAGTMTVDDICEMPVSELALPDSHLHLWTTNAFLPEAFRVIEAWGFEYRSVFVWVKPQMGIGNYWRVSHEFMLLGIRGNAKRFGRRDLKSWMSIDRRQHSEKPHEVRSIVQQVSPGPFLELFGREAIDGWTVFGNQVRAKLFA